MSVSSCLMPGPTLADALALTQALSVAVVEAWWTEDLSVVYWQAGSCAGGSRYACVVLLWTEHDRWQRNVGD